MGYGRGCCTDQDDESGREGRREKQAGTYREAWE
jgi:hypothetical protein